MIYTLSDASSAYYIYLTQIKLFLRINLRYIGNIPHTAHVLSFLPDVFQ